MVEKLMFSTLWAKRKELMPGANDDELQYAFTALLAEPNVADPAARLVEFGLEWRRMRTRITKNEVFAAPVMTAAIVEEQQERGEIDSPELPTIEDAELAMVVNEVVESMPWEAAQAYILVHLRGVSPDEAAEMLDMEVGELMTHAEGVNGMVRAGLVKTL